MRLLAVSLRLSRSCLKCVFPQISFFISTVILTINGTFFLRQLITPRRDCNCFLVDGAAKAMSSLMVEAEGRMLKMWLAPVEIWYPQYVTWVLHTALAGLNFPLDLMVLCSNLLASRK